MRKFAPMLLAALLTGCALMFDPGYVMKGWVGGSSDAVIKQWGAPTETAVLSDSSRVLTWREKGPGGPNACVRSFIVDQQGIVRHWRISGCEAPMGGTAPATSGH